MPTSPKWSLIPLDIPNTEKWYQRYLPAHFSSEQDSKKLFMEHLEVIHNVFNYKLQPWPEPQPVPPGDDLEDQLQKSLDKYNAFIQSIPSILKDLEGKKKLYLEKIRCLQKKENEIRLLCVLEYNPEMCWIGSFAVDDWKKSILNGQGIQRKRKNTGSSMATDSQSMVNNLPSLSTYFTQPITPLLKSISSQCTSNMEKYEEPPEAIDFLDNFYPLVRSPPPSPPPSFPPKDNDSTVIILSDEDSRDFLIPNSLDNITPYSPNFLDNNSCQGFKIKVMKDNESRYSQNTNSPKKVIKCNESQHSPSKDSLEKCLKSNESQHLHNRDSSKKDIEYNEFQHSPSQDSLEKRLTSNEPQHSHNKDSSKTVIECNETQHLLNKDSSKKVIKCNESQHSSSQDSLEKCLKSNESQHSHNKDSSKTVVECIESQHSPSQDFLEKRLKSNESQHLHNKDSSTKVIECNESQHSQNQDSSQERSKSNESQHSHNRDSSKNVIACNETQHSQCQDSSQERLKSNESQHSHNKDSSKKVMECNEPQHSRSQDSLEKRLKSNESYHSHNKDCSKKVIECNEPQHSPRQDSIETHLKSNESQHSNNRDSSKNVIACNEPQHSPSQDFLEKRLKSNESQHLHNKDSSTKVIECNEPQHSPCQDFLEKRLKSNESQHLHNEDSSTEVIECNESQHSQSQDSSEKRLICNEPQHSHNKGPSKKRIKFDESQHSQSQDSSEKRLICNEPQHSHNKDLSKKCNKYNVSQHSQSQDASDKRLKINESLSISPAVITDTILETDKTPSSPPLSSSQSTEAMSHESCPATRLPVMVFKRMSSFSYQVHLKAEKNQDHSTRDMIQESQENQTCTIGAKPSAFPLKTEAMEHSDNIEVLQKYNPSQKTIDFKECQKLCGKQTQCGSSNYSQFNPKCPSIISLMEEPSNEDSPVSQNQKQSTKSIRREVSQLSYQSSPLRQSPTISGGLSGLRLNLELLHENFPEVHDNLNKNIKQEVSRQFEIDVKLHSSPEPISTTCDPLCSTTAATERLFAKPSSDSVSERAIYDIKSFPLRTNESFLTNSSMIPELCTKDPRQFLNSLFNYENCSRSSTTMSLTSPSSQENEDIGSSVNNESPLHTPSPMLRSFSENLTNLQQQIILGSSPPLEQQRCHANPPFSPQTFSAPLPKPWQQSAFNSAPLPPYSFPPTPQFTRPPHNYRCLLPYRGPYHHYGPHFYNGPYPHYGPHSHEGSYSDYRLHYHRSPDHYHMNPSFINPYPQYSNPTFNQTYQQPQVPYQFLDNHLQPPPTPLPDSPPLSVPGFEHSPTYDSEI